jgi:hypothetical protein
VGGGQPRVEVEVVGAVGEALEDDAGVGGLELDGVALLLEDVRPEVGDGDALLPAGVDADGDGVVVATASGGEGAGRGERHGSGQCESLGTHCSPSSHRSCVT